MLWTDIAALLTWYIKLKDETGANGNDRNKTSIDDIHYKYLTQKLMLVNLE